MKYRSGRHQAKNLKAQLGGPGGESTFTLYFAGGRIEEIKVPCENSARLRWLLRMMNQPNDPTSQLIRSCESYESSVGGDECGLIRSTPAGAEFETLRLQDITQSTSNRKAMLAALGLQEDPVEAPPPPAPAPESESAAPENVIVFPEGGE